MKADGGRRGGAETDIALAAQGAAQGSYTAKQGQYLAFIYYLHEDPQALAVGS